MDRIAWWIATWFGSGLVPGAPGTAGSIAGWLLAVAAWRFWCWGRVELMVATGVLLVPAVWASHRLAAAAGAHDPQHVVVDEVAGVWLTLWGATAYNWKSAILGLVLFRLFDIWKPPPARQLEGLPGGFGIVADDLAAGVWAALVLRGAGWFNLY